MSWAIVYRRGADARITVSAHRRMRQSGLVSARRPNASAEQVHTLVGPGGVEISQAPLNALCGHGGQT
jgi:hypothetical protein